MIFGEFIISSLLLVNMLEPPIFFIIFATDDIFAMPLLIIPIFIFLFIKSQIETLC